MVVEHVTRLSERRTQTTSETFPDGALASVRSAVEAVPASVFDGSTKHREISGFDAAIADGLPQYEYEGDATGGYNPNCKLWSHLGFDYSVDLYDAADRIAIEAKRANGRTSATVCSSSRKGTAPRKTAARRSNSAVWSCR